MRIQKAVKRSLDIIISFAFLILFSVPLAVMVIAIKLESKGPVFFNQERAGKNGETFTVHKFRSLRTPEDKRQAFYSEQEVTRIGKLIRKWRIDEIPQFVNVLQGDMSIVGPRPTLPYQIERYDETQLRRLEVLPGLTGWSQIHGDSALSWPQRIEMDIWYIDNWSLWLDLKIMLKTPSALLRIRKVNTDEVSPPDEISTLE
ncbi:MAG: sugar transferase [Actinobacteria bacterium]|nr:sugar transferase [Actinomycetota bacterium]